ncbi:unnamed protein product [Microthlaspi erraticum]|uniref:Integrase catalytic domain-containing protein n=1 Tax=Microthlaspi erraticum TaxID=1685480 RepID=A0A6D2ICB1_9BRAS|nr:unnamed protein product [Microthlaspi erraticum]
MRWAMDVVGPLKIPQKRFILIVTDYFTKWVEAESYANIRAEDVEKFVWKNIICRHGLPYEIVTDNGTPVHIGNIREILRKLEHPPQQVRLPDTRTRERPGRSHEQDDPRRNQETARG